MFNQKYKIKMKKIAYLKIMQIIILKSILKKAMNIIKRNIHKIYMVMKFLKKGIAVFVYGIVGKIDYVRDYENLYYIVERKN